MRALRGHISGLCLPTYVLDIPGGAGKVPLGPNYIVGRTGDTWQIQSYTGEVIPTRTWARREAAPGSELKSSRACSRYSDARAGHPRHPRLLRRARFHEVETPLLVPVPSMEPYLEVFETEFVDACGQAAPGVPDQLARIRDEAAAGGRAAAHLPDLQGVPQRRRHRDPGATRSSPFWNGTGRTPTTRHHARLREPAAGDLPGHPRPGRATPAAAAVLQYQGMEVDLTPPWERITVREALARYAGVDLDGGDGAGTRWRQ